MVEFNQDQIKSKTGYFTLDWSKENETKNAHVYLYNKTNSSWNLLYEGTNSRYSISGLLDGNYEYAICEKDFLNKTSTLSSESKESNIYCSFAKAEIQHYNSNQTLVFLSVGIFLFLSIFVTIVSSIFFASKGISKG